MTTDAAGEISFQTLLNAFVPAGTVLTATATDASGYVNGTGTLDVLDHETLTVVVEAAQISEEAGTTTATVAQSNTDNGTALLVTLVSSDTTEATVPATVTIPAGQSSATFDIDAVADLTVDGTKEVTVTATAAGYGEGSDTVNVIDDDTAGITVGPTAGLTTTEGGVTATFTIELHSQPTADVTIGLTSSDTTEGTAAPASATFTAANWNTPQTVTVSGVGDDLDDGDVAYTIVTAATSTDANYDGLNAADVTVTNRDNDVAGFTLSKTTAGSQDTCTVVLTAEPESDVVLSATSGDTGEVTVSPAALTFTPANWNVPQTVTLTGADDALIDGSQVTPVAVGVVAAASDDRFDGVEDGQVLVTTTDNDLAGFRVSKSTASVSESGNMDIFSIVLTAQPALNVVLTVTSGDTGEATVTPASVTFTPGNWNLARIVTISGVDDWLLDGLQMTPVTVSVADSLSDDHFDTLSDQVVTVTTTDDDMAGFRLSKVTSSVSENGTSDTFTVVLTAQPDTSVTLTVTSGDTGEVAVSPAELTFAPGNWNSPQTVTVTGVDDRFVDGSQTTAVWLTVQDAISDSKFAAVADQTVTVTTADNDVAGLTLSRTSLTVSEAGSADTFTVALTAQPYSDVVVTAISADLTEATVSPSVLAFTPADWNVPQTVTIAGVDEHVIDGSQLTQITVSVDDAWSDNQFDPLADQSVFVTTTDDDEAGFVLSKTEANVSESGTSDTFTLVLPAQPASAVILLVSSGEGEGEGQRVWSAATPSDSAAVAPREPVQIASVRVQPVPAHFVALGNARESFFGSAVFVEVWNVRDLSSPAGALLPVSPSTTVPAQAAGDQPMFVRETDLGPLAVNRRGVTSDAVFDAWPDAPWNELADTLARELHRVTL